MKTGSMVGLGILGAVMLFGVMPAACSMNTIPLKDENVQQKWAQVETQYQRRNDLIPGLVATVKGAANAETNFMVQALEKRADAIRTLPKVDPKNPQQMEQFSRAQAAISADLKLIKEAYPKFAANKNFTGLQTQLEGTENRIQVARRDYTVAVQDLNGYIRTFPGIVGNMVVGVKPAAQFKADEGANRAVKVEF